MFGFVCRKMGLFPALLHREKVFCQFSMSHADFYLIFLKRTFWFYFGLSYVVFSIMFLSRGLGLLPVRSESPWFFTSFYSKQRFYLCLAK